MTATRATAAEIVARLRAGAGSKDSLALQKLYEKWLSCDLWSFEGEAIPLLVGEDPSCWPVDEAERELVRQLAGLLTGAQSGAPEDITPASLAHRAREAGIELHAEFARLLEFIQSVLPVSAPAEEDVLGQSAERELLLGAALALVTRFPADCRDEHGFFDGGLIADLILQKAALWFPLEPPRATRDEITALLERYLSG